MFGFNSFEIWRTRINEDLFRRLLLGSDPVPALGQARHQKNKKKLTSRMKKLLVGFDDDEASDSDDDVPSEDSADDEPSDDEGEYY